MPYLGGETLHLNGLQQIIPEYNPKKKMGRHWSSSHLIEAGLKVKDLA